MVAGNEPLCAVPAVSKAVTRFDFHARGVVGKGVNTRITGDISAYFYVAYIVEVSGLRGFLRRSVRLYG